MNLTSALILSDKSSGSSVLQRELAKHAAVSIMRKPHHNESETLYWSKAVAVLERPQPPMIDSSILPMSRAVASDALGLLLRDNLNDPCPTPTTESELFGAWRQLTTTYGPVFLEKSPHHLHNRAVLELLLEARSELSDIDFRFVGLVRNPVDTLYSMWRRWKTVPEAREAEWCRAYENLRWLQQEAPEVTHIVRYEDLITDPRCLTGLLAFLGLSAEPGVGVELHGGSLQAWRSDRAFGYQPGAEVRRVAARFGYVEEDLANTTNGLWPIVRELGSGLRRARTWLGSMRRSGRG